MSRWKPACKRCGVKFKIHHDEIFRENCDPCIDAINETQQMDDSIRLMLETMKPENRERFLEMPREEKEMIVNKAWEDGILKWRFSNGREKGS